MSIDPAAVATPPKALTPTALGQSLGFDERWAAWLAKGAAHDRAVHRKMAFAAPILLVAAVVIYAVFGR